MKTQPRRRRSGGSGRTEPDDVEVIELPVGSIIREGRYIHLVGSGETPEREAFLDELAEALPELDAERDAHRAELLELLSASDPAEILAQATLTYLWLDPNSYRESEHDRSPAHVEYLALQALSVGLDGRSPIAGRVAVEHTGRAIELVRSIFSLSSSRLVLQAIRERRDVDDLQIAEYQFKARLGSMAVRGTGYREHLDRVLLGCFNPLADECRDILGFCAAEALQLVDGIADLLEQRFRPRLERARQTQKSLRKLAKRARRGKSTPLPDAIGQLSPSEAREALSLAVMSELLEDCRAIGTFSAEELAAAASVDSRVAQAFLDAFTCAPEEFAEEHHRFPFGAQPIGLKPVLRVDGAYLVPAPQTFRDALRPRMEELLGSDGAIWERYARARGKYLEKESVAVLSSALPGSASWTAIQWKSDDVGSDLDGLVAIDDVALRVQCKAGQIDAATRRGAPRRMIDDLNKLIGSAAQQHKALAGALDVGPPASLSIPADTAAALELPLQIEVVVTLDEVITWATRSYGLREVGILPGDRPIPWVLSLMDLMAVADLLTGSQLLHYVARRIRLEQDGRIDAHDELDWLGHYLKEGLYFDQQFERRDSPNKVSIHGYSEDIDAWYFAREGARTVSTPKPEQPLRSELKAFLGQLERQRPRHWMLASLALLEGDDEARELWAENLKRMHAQAERGRASDTTQVFSGFFGVSVLVDHRRPLLLVADSARRYISRKRVDIGEEHWIAIVEGRGRDLAVLIEPPQKVREPIGLMFGLSP